MWKIFDFVPGVVLAGMLALSIVTLTVGHVRIKSLQAEFSTYKAQVAENTRKAEAEARAKEQKLQREVERISDEAARKQTVLAGRLATANRSVGELRDTIEQLNSRPAPADPSIAAIAREASTARQLLGACSEEYRSVAQGADELRDQVTGLQQYVASVCKN